MNHRMNPLKPDKLCEGLGVSPGKVTGVARHVHVTYPEDSGLPESIDGKAAVNAGDIVVLDELYPGGMDLLKRAGGMVIGPKTEGVASHSAVAARELHVPAVMTRTDPYSHIPANQLIGLDGDRGRVYRGFRPR